MQFRKNFWADPKTIDKIVILPRIENYAVRLDWYPYTGQEAPMPLDDIQLDDDEEEDDEDDDDDVPDFVNFWNQMPGPPQLQDIPLS